MAGRFYIDTSAYLAMVLGEAGGAAIATELAGAQVMSSSLLALEAHRSLVRLGRDGLLSASELQHAIGRVAGGLDQLLIRDLTLDLCRSPAMPVVSTPRSLDLAHLTTALWFHRLEPLTRFVSLDEPQNHSARELGLPV
jgi:hypothetical protein